MNRLVIAFFGVLAAAAPAHAAIEPPFGAPILMDGKCDDSEWRDAMEAAVAPGHVLRVKRTERYVFMCITYPDDSFGTLEGYVTTARQTTPLNIHVSAKVGDRLWTEEGWPRFEWWAAEGWWSNAVRYNSFEDGEQRFLGAPAREIQFDLDHFGREDWRIMFDMYYGRRDDGTYDTVPLPVGSTFEDPASWLELRF